MATDPGIACERRTEPVYCLHKEFGDEATEGIAEHQLFNPVVAFLCRYPIDVVQIAENVIHGNGHLIDRQAVRTDDIATQARRVNLLSLCESRITLHSLTPLPDVPQPAGPIARCALMPCRFVSPS